MKNHDHKNPRSAVRRGFTLTELLVVILIIAALAALSFLGIRRIREVADKASSTRNLAQLQVANVAYATDNNGNFVSIRVNDENGKTTRWFEDSNFLRNLTGEVLDSSGNQVKTVPVQMLDPKVVRARKPLFDRLYTSYGMNDTGLKLGSEPNLNSSHKLGRMPDPARSMAFATATDFRITYNSRFNWDFENPNDSKTADGSIAYRHGEKVLVVYFDGHVGEMSKADFKEIDKSKGGKSSAFWKPGE
jgi:prepilin-type N-terminal cleavage/methylation domain-containing protein/prepilin-type processing-associated H-X9-DG protein